MNNKNVKFVLGFSIATLILLGALLLSHQPVVAQADNTCPDGNGWTKIDSGDLSQYPVSGATEYCFKAGNFLVSSIPSGGFGQEGACNADNIQNCGLSHWSYFIPETVPTEPPVEPTEPPVEPSVTFDAQPDQPPGGSGPAVLPILATLLVGGSTIGLASRIILKKKS